MEIPKSFRGDAAFASPKLLTVLEAEGYRYAIRLKPNAVLERQIVHMLKRPLGPPSKKPKVPYHGFRYQAKSCDRGPRVVAKVEWHAGELFHSVGFVVTNLRRSPKWLVKFYNGRGTAARWIKEGKNALKWTRLSCRRFKDNQVRLQLFALADKLGNFLRQMALPREVKHWSLTTLRRRCSGSGPRSSATPGRDVSARGDGGAPGAVRGDPGADQSAACGAGTRVIVRRGRMGVASSRGGCRWSALR